MFALKALVLCVVASVANAHFFFKYPEERGSTFLDGASQYIYPCAGVNQTMANRTIWPLTGGSLSLDLHHPWTYVYVNLGMGTITSTFNISLTPNFLNVTGNGTFCLPKVALPAGTVAVDGQNATIQVVTGGRSGSALYNCADITFRSNASLVTGGTCVNSTGVAATVVTQAGVSSATTSNTTSSTAATTTAAKSGANSDRIISALGVVFVGSVLAFCL